MTRTKVEDRPCAAKGLVSYRFTTENGHVMIGARDEADAIREARRSTNLAGTLFVWVGTAQTGNYEPIYRLGDRKK